MTVIASLTFTPDSPGLCMAFGSCSSLVNSTTEPGNALGYRLKLKLTQDSGTTSDVHIPGKMTIPGRTVPSGFTQVGPEVAGNVVSAVFSVVAGVTYTLTLETGNSAGIFTSQTYSDIHLLARSYNL